jgi:hypothetical protein
MYPDIPVCMIISGNERPKRVTHNGGYVVLYNKKTRLDNPMSIRAVVTYPSREVKNCSREKCEHKMSKRPHYAHIDSPVKLGRHYI